MSDKRNETNGPIDKIQKEEAESRAEYFAKALGKPGWPAWLTPDEAESVGPEN